MNKWVSSNKEKIIEDRLYNMWPTIYANKMNMADDALLLTMAQILIIIQIQIFIKLQL